MKLRLKEVWRAYKRARPEWLVGAGRLLKKKKNNRPFKVPLIAPAVARLSGIARQSRSSPDGRPAHRGTILFVTHDLDVGGAQQVVKTLASWFLRATGYDAKFVSMNSGAWWKQFQAIAPVFNLGASLKISGVDRARSELEAFAGSDVVAVFVNSIASAGFFDHWFRNVPAITYVHELPKVIESFGDNIHKVKARAARVLGGSAAVVDALVARYEIPRSSCGVVHDFIEVVGADTEPGPEARATARRLLNVDPSAFVVMACGVVHWRKSPHLFIDMAEQVARQTKQPTRFVWIGDGPDLEECRTTVRRRGLGAIVEFIGYRDSVYDYFRAADVFSLPSEEDPFPLVCLYAALAEVPIVCFDGAGGIPELVAKGCGIAVPFLDAEAMANAIIEYARQPQLKADHGRAGRRIVRAEFTVATAGPKMLATIREVTGLRPQVSVVVPNYNYARFLPERLESIYRQSYQDFEVILLDDCSVDGSVEILNAAADRDPRTIVVTNSENSGSPFRQWLKGMSLAKGNLIWVAEADDACDERFLERVVPAFNDRNVFLAYAASYPIDEDGKRLGDYRPIYLDRIAPGRWSKSFVASDHEEVNAALAVANSIPNASAVVFRPFVAEPDFTAAVTAMRMCGDWFFYIRALRGGLVAFVADELNFHRRHATTVTRQTEGRPQYFTERADVLAYVARNFSIEPATLARAEAFTDAELARFPFKSDEERSHAAKITRRERMAKAVPSLLVVASDLSPGGGQMFAIRLANAWMQKGGRAFLLNVGHFPDHPNVVAKIDKRVAVFDARSPGFSLSRLLALLDIDVIHSTIWWADKLVYYNRQRLPTTLPWIVTMHGCHETLLDAPDCDVEFPAAVNAMVQRVDTWVYTAKKNLRVFKHFGHSPSNLQTIINGYVPELPAPMSRSSIGLRDDSFVLCLASRAIEEKGWREAIEATVLLNARGLVVDLLLIGEGPLRDKLEASGNLPPYIHLVGQVSNLQDYISVSDAGLLPSYFSGESMPLVLIEFMAQGKPIIATDVGEIAWMVGTGDDRAGTTIPLEAGGVSAQTLADAVEPYVAKGANWEAAARGSRKQFEKFDMSTMLDRYGALYEEAIERRRERQVADRPGPSGQDHFASSRQIEPA